jgi:hypothetical protein
MPSADNAEHDPCADGLLGLEWFVKALDAAREHRRSVDTPAVLEEPGLERPEAAS